MGIIENLAGVLFTSACPICGEAIGFNEQDMCPDYKKNTKYVREPQCEKCGRPLNNEEQLLCSGCVKLSHEFEKGVCIFEHSGKIRKSIYDFKYANKRENGEFYGREAARVYGRTFKHWNIDAIVPVPIHKERELRRGYNQALVLAEAVAGCTGIRLEKNLLVRVKKTEPQKELTDEMRYLNLKNAFAVDETRMTGLKNILIVDDIYTTGSTVDACSVTLKKAGAKKVYVLCVSAGVGV